MSYILLKIPVSLYYLTNNYRGEQETWENGRGTARAGGKLMKL